jgi:hypothetical protein
MDLSWFLCVALWLIGNGLFTRAFDYVAPTIPYRFQGNVAAAFAIDVHVWKKSVPSSARLLYLGSLAFKALAAVVLLVSEFYRPTSTNEQIVVGTFVVFLVGRFLWRVIIYRRFLMASDTQTEI